ncbi:hypothetical protein [uncultured Brevundimonas sp.]|uniref:hypothetical protein n=1 Tax=uncultured Brevundimonas sp. TaxID=213418 RepID=UPI00263323F9|nr:hypothetical protein [uncultured Brevundimonas sp.]
MSRLIRRGVLAGGFPALTATLSPTTLFGSSTGGTVTTSGSVTIAASGGSGNYTFTWERVSGSTAMTALSVDAATTNFRSTGMGELETRSAVWRGKVTDTLTGSFVYTSNTVSVSLTRNQAALSAYLSPAELDGYGNGTTVATSGVATVYASGGSGSYSYSWERVSGSGGPSPSSATSSSTGFSSSSIASGANQTAVWRCIVTDTVNLNTVATGNVTVSLTRGYASLSVSVAPATLTGSGNVSPVVTSGSATATVTGGSGTWTGAWEWDGGATTGSIVATSPNSATTTFRSGDVQAAGTSRSQGYRFRVTDSVTGAQAVSNSVVSTLARYAVLSASVSPSSLSGTSQNTPVITSGSATCTASGGSGSYAYSWEWDQGTSTGFIVPSTASNPSTKFQSGDAQPSGVSRTAGFICRVTDTVTGNSTVTGSTVVTLNRSYATMTVSVSPSSLSGSGASEQVTTSGSATVSVSGGSGNFSYQWIYDGTGTGGLNPLDGASASTAFRSGVMPPNQTYTAGFFCRVTDNVTGEAKDTGSVAITLTRTASAISYAEVSPAEQLWPPESPTAASATVNHDGVGPFTYSWSATGSTTVISASSKSTFFERATSNFTVTITCRVTDLGAGGIYIDASGVIEGYF